MPAALYLYLIAVMQDRTNEIPLGRCFGEGAQRVERRERAGRRLKLSRLGARGRADLLKQLDLGTSNALVCSQDPLLPFLELRRRISLGVRERLPPFIVVGHARDISLGYLYVI